MGWGLLLFQPSWSTDGWQRLFRTHQWRGEASLLCKVVSIEHLSLKLQFFPLLLFVAPLGIRSAIHHNHHHHHISGHQICNSIWGYCQCYRSIYYHLSRIFKDPFEIHIRQIKPRSFSFLSDVFFFCIFAHNFVFHLFYCVPKKLYSLTKNSQK